ncbi:MAG: putative rane protein [Acidimicrobiales bacterium]|nr:putative rane protein [Acidimicrobiales bacterium]
MTNQVVAWSGLVASMVFVGLAIGISYWQQLRLERRIAVAVVRSLAQLMVVGVALVAVVKPSTPLVWSWLWVAAIVVFAGVTVARRAPAIPGLLKVSLACNATVAGLNLAVIYGFGIFPLEGRTLVPVAGMTIGNAMNAGVVGATRLAEVVAERRAEIEARVALGLPGPEALRPFIRQILRTAMGPQIESTAALGIVFLPGAMTGLVLAGVAPLDAVRTQLALMYVILAGVAMTTMFTVLGASRQVMTPDDRLLVVPRRRD